MIFIWFIRPCGLTPLDYSLELHPQSIPELKYDIIRKIGEIEQQLSIYIIENCFL